MQAHSPNPQDHLKNDMKPTYWQAIPNIVGPATKKEFPQIGQIGIRNALESFIVEYSDAATRLLDGGCNTGVEGCRLYEKGYRGFYTGVDSNKKALEFALSNLQGTSANFTLADLEFTGYPDRSFDIVMTKDVIEHAESYRKIMGELARLTNRWLMVAMFIKMHDRPNVISYQPDGFYHNRYARREFYEFVGDEGFSEPRILFAEREDELLLFERQH